MTRQLKAHMVDPSRRDVADAHSALEWPCATMCTSYHQRFPSPLRPRLLVFLYSDRWMVYDKYGLTDRPRRQESMLKGGTLGADVDLSVSLFPGLMEPLTTLGHIWRNGFEPQQEFLQRLSEKLRTKLGRSTSKFILAPLTMFGRCQNVPKRKNKWIG